MTALDARLAPGIRTHRAPRVAAPATDLHSRMIANSNRVLATAGTTEATAQDALANLVGALINTVPAGGVLSEFDLAALLERTANRLGCPPAVRVGLFARLVRALGFRRAVTR